MASIDELSQRIETLDGYIASALTDHTSGMTLSSHSVTDFDIELAAAAGTEVVRAQFRAIEHMGGGQKIQDILITLDTQYHLIYMSPREDFHGLFAYLVLDRARGNLALARRWLTQASEVAEM